MTEVESHTPKPRRRFSPWGLIGAAGAVACLATILGFFGRFWWFFDLFSHFRVQYFLGLGFVALLLLVPRQRKAAACFAILSLVNLMVILPLYLGGGANSDHREPIVRTMLINVNRELGDPALVAKAVKEWDPEILVLEEIDSRWLTELEDVLNAYPHSRAQPRDDNFGIGLFSKLPLEEAVVVDIGGAGVPSIIAKLKLGTKTLKVLATHPVPPAGGRYSQWRNDQLEGLADHVSRNLHDSPTLLLGDLNVSPWSFHFKQLLRHTGLRDSSQGRGVQPTWPTHLPFLAIPLDHCLYSPDLVVLQKKVGPDVGSDHYPIIVDIALGADNGE